MNRIQNQKLKHLVGLANFFNENDAIASTLVNSATWRPKLERLATDIMYHSGQQATSQTGNATSKNSIKASLSQQAYFIAVCSKAYARATNNMILYAKVNFTLSQLTSIGDIDLLNTANLLHTAAAAEVVGIGNVSTLTAAFLTTFKQLVGDFMVFLPQAQATRSSSKVHTEAIVRLFGEAAILLEEIVDYVGLTNFTEPIFYQKFLKVNVIGNVLTRNRALQINVSDKDTSAPLFRADITITDALGAKVATRKTTNKGNSFIQDLKEQNYTVSVVQGGYDNKTATISIIDGSTYLLNIEMDKQA